MNTKNMPAVLKQLRVDHYIKNIMVFIPMIFSLSLTNTALYPRIFCAFAALCAASSAVYALNDIADKERDAAHPVKKYRPLPAGKLSVTTVWTICGICAAIALGFSALLGIQNFIVILAYIVINLLYSFILKHRPIIDVSCIATGFFLRIIMGTYAIGVPLSGWLLLTITVLAFYLGFGKRKNELLAMRDKCGETRTVLMQYSETFLNSAMNTMMTLAVAFYALWSMDTVTITRLGTDNMIYTTLIVIVGAMRYAFALEKSGSGDPTEILLTDRFIQAVALIYVLTVVSMIYFF